MGRSAIVVGTFLGMPGSTPTILATSGGLRPGSRTQLEFAPLLHYAVELSGVAGRAPRVCHIGTAGGDQQWFNALLSEAGRAAGMTVTHLNLFPMPSVADPGALLLDQDVIWVGGGSVANLLAVWRLHGLDHALREAWQAGVVLAGVSAGSICWHVGGTTDSFGPDLRPVTNGLGFLPHSAGVHYDAEPQRRPLFQKLVGTGALPAGYATDNGTGVVYRGTEFAEAVSEVTGKGVYYVTTDGGAASADGPDGREVREDRIEPRLLSGAARL
jgi:peptidase E